MKMNRTAIISDTRVAHYHFPSSIQPIYLYVLLTEPLYFTTFDDLLQKKSGSVGFLTLKSGRFCREIAFRDLREAAGLIFIDR